MHLRTDTSANSHFARVPTISRSRNAFSIEEKHTTTIQFDTLYPIFWRYTYPGDTISMTQKLLARLNTQVSTLYDDLYFDMHAWYVPIRLIQTNWARFQFNYQTTPGQDNSALTTPSIDLTTLGSGGFPSKSLYDYFGLPTKIDLHAAPGNTNWINNYLARGYALIWNTNYRDENLQSPVVVDLDEGPDEVSDYSLLKRGRRFDRFSSSLVAAQKGTQQTLPLGTSAPLTGIAPVLGLGTHDGTTFTAVTNGTTLRDASGTQNTAGTTGTNVWQGLGTNPAMQMTGASPQSSTVYPYVRVDASNIGTLAVNLASAVGVPLNTVRQSFAIQQLLEADSRGGTRDVESIAHRWGVTVPDFRLQRPEYIGGQTFTFDGKIVPQTSATGVTGSSTPQANLTQFSQAMSALTLNHSFVEHGVFMILLSARSNMTYQQGLLRELSYKTRYDYYQPEFANLGEVAVLNKEIYMDGSSNDAGTFGFQEYGYELRYGMNKVTGEMRSNYATPKDSKHMADDYLSLPTLGSAWIQSNTPISRNIVVSAATADPIELNTFAVGRLARTLPMFSIPGLMRL